LELEGGDNSPSFIKYGKVSKNTTPSLQFELERSVLILAGLQVTTIRDSLGALCVRHLWENRGSDKIFLKFVMLAILVTKVIQHFGPNVRSLLCYTFIGDSSWLNECGDQHRKAVLAFLAFFNTLLSSFRSQLEQLFMGRKIVREILEEASPVGDTEFALANYMDCTLLSAVPPISHRIGA
jgi:hypothetical protein